MKKIKILVPIWLQPNSTNQIIFLYENLFEEFKKNVELEIIWFVYTFEKNSYLPKREFEKNVQIQDYSDAIKVLEQTTPDIVFATPSFNLIDYAFLLASKNKNIPVISGTGQSFDNSAWVNSIFKLLSYSFNSSDQKSSKKKLPRLRFVIKKGLFLIQTQRKLNLKRIEVLKEFFNMYKLYKAKITLLYNSKYSADLCWVSGKVNYNTLIQAGYKENQIILSGNPIYDKKFQNKIKTQKVFSEKIRVLFAPNPSYEHGYRSKKQQDETIMKIVKELNANQSKFEIIVKIHPTSAIKKFYTEIINEINPEIQIFQEGSVEDFFDKTDVIVSYDHSSVNIFGFLSDIPSVVCNFYGDENKMYSQYNITDECSMITDLNNKIISAAEKGINIKKYNKFIQDLFFKDDGLASKRIVDAVLKLLKNKF